VRCSFWASCKCSKWVFTRDVELGLKFLAPTPGIPKLLASAPTSTILWLQLHNDLVHWKPLYYLCKSLAPQTRAVKPEAKKDDHRGLICGLRNSQWTSAERFRALRPSFLEFFFGHLRKIRSIGRKQTSSAERFRWKVGEKKRNVKKTSAERKRSLFTAIVLLFYFSGVSTHLFDTKQCETYAFAQCWSAPFKTDSAETLFLVRCLQITSVTVIVAWMSKLFRPAAPGFAQKSFFLYFASMQRQTRRLALKVFWHRQKSCSPTLHCTVIGLTRERFVALSLPSWTHLRTRYRGVFTLEGLKDLLRALGPWYCESWGIGENEKVKADSTTERCFS